MAECGPGDTVATTTTELVLNMLPGYVPVIVSQPGKMQSQTLGVVELFYSVFKLLCIHAAKQNHM